MWLQDLGVRATHLIHDRDTKFSARFRDFWKSEDVKCLKTPVRAPQANAFCECCIGKVKRECLDYFICFSLNHLNYINYQWLLYYNEHRPHQGTDIGNKVLRMDFVPTDKGKIKREQRLGGVISWYYREAA
ncbi:MAG: integrase core domain-containing protein [Spirochaetales bacterium]|nr:integrase core domain-containing protein [Spirochaetales bacterium]